MADYDDALRAAGATVLAYRQFGSYSGDWFAHVEHDGARFWLRDYYGSCSGCDALEGELGWEPWGDDSQEEKATYAEKLAAFGARYLEPQERLTHDQVIAVALENIDWDSDAQEMVDWLIAQGIETRSDETAQPVQPEG